MANNKKARNVVLAVLGLLVIALVCALAFGKKGGQGVPVIAEAVKVRDFSTTVIVSGQAEAADAVVVRPSISGQVVEVPVEEGQTVRAGQILARLDDRGARQALRQAEQAESMARVELETLTRANEERSRQHRLDREKAQRAAASAKESLSQAQARLDRLERLHAEGVATDQQLEEAKDQFRLAKERHTDAEAALAALAESLGLQDTKLTETRLAQAIRNRADAEADLELTLLRAPQNGVVLVKALEPGVAVTPGMAVFTIGTTGALRARALVDETYIVAVRPGQPVKVTNDALPGRIFQGRVINIAPQGQIQEKLSLFEVEIGFTNRDGALRPGMTVDCEITTARASKVPVVPLLAVFDDEDKAGRKYVYLMHNGKAKKVQVTLGLTGEAEAEIRRGLHGGEMLITGEIDTLRLLKDGQAVTAKKAKAGEK
ncbi:MAG: efflux RND transporter periplasmic adaptor subunit [Bacteroidota bacterium]